MITIMKTKSFLNALDDAYAKGVSAGTFAEKCQQREDQNRRLYDMYQRGKSAGYLEAFENNIEEIDIEAFKEILGEIKDETVESV